MKLSHVPKFLWALLLIGSHFFTVIAATTNGVSSYSSRAWQMEHGLPHNAVNAVLQTQDGYLWAATFQGLARFDGIHFTVFNPENTPEIKDSVVRTLCETRDGTLWFHGDKPGLISFHDAKFVHYSLPVETQIRTLYESRDGALWIGTTNGAAKYQDGKFTWLTTADGLVNDRVLTLCEDHEGNLWIGTAAGLTRYKDGFHEIFHNRHYLPAMAARFLHCDKEGSLWIGTTGGGVARRRKGEWSYFKKAEGLPDLFVTSICEDSRGQLWVGTMGGVARLDQESFVTVLNSEGASFEAVFSVREDREGNLWLGTKEGLAQLRPRVFQTIERKDGLSGNNVMSICEDGSENLWLATWGGGLNRLKDGQTTIYNYDTDKLPDVLLSLRETRDGSLWVGSDYDSGLFQFNDGKFTHYGTNEGIIHSAIRVIYEDRDGDLWFGTTGALYSMRDGKVQRFTAKDGLAGSIIRVIHEDREGNLWIGTNEGLSRRRQETASRGQEKGSNGQEFQSVTIKDGLAANDVISIHEDSESNLWIGTGSGGLMRYRNGKFATYSTRSGLFNNSILEILEDDQGHLWISCFSGVFRVSRKDFDDLDRGAISSLRCTAFGKSDGMGSVQCNGVSKPAGWKAKDGRLWFPTTRGVVVVDPKAVKAVSSPPPVVIEEVIADKRKVPGDTWQVTRKTGHHDTRHLSLVTIPPGRGELEFHYTALSFSVPEKNRFKYKLEGVDPDWVEAGARRVAYYNNIRPGNYTFTVRGCNNDGVWNELGKNVKFTLQPHFWQTKWFGGLIAFTAIGLVASTARYVTWKKVQGKLRRLEQQHAVERERTRIARDMHDDLGTRLTEILMAGHRAKESKGNETEKDRHLDRITGVSRELIDNLDAIVWAVNPKNDSLDKLVLYISEFAGPFLDAAGIRYRLSAPNLLPECQLSSEARHNIFLIVKEALNNAVKHSGASEARIEVAVDDEELRLSISDNGKGFVSMGLAFGDGLSNMEKRVQTLGGKFALRTEPGKGTRIQLEIPFPDL